MRYFCSTDFHQQMTAFHRSMGSFVSITAEVFKDQLRETAQIGFGRSIYAHNFDKCTGYREGESSFGQCSNKKLDEKELEGEAQR